MCEISRSGPCKPVQRCICARCDGAATSALTTVVICSLSSFPFPQPKSTFSSSAEVLLLKILGVYSACSVSRFLQSPRVAPALLSELRRGRHTHLLKRLSNRKRGAASCNKLRITSLTVLDIFLASLKELCRNSTKAHLLHSDSHATTSWSSSLRRSSQRNECGASFLSNRSERAVWESLVSPLHDGFSKVGSRNRT